ncbi:hypothetical protein [Streptomyces sp. NPDC057545]|uniref:hypothetical protein n=1 Tax=Streptomyces sp. NPDC057545 TaxID=3346164 RepID=UPI0036CE27A8
MGADAAAEGLTPRPLRVYMSVTYAQARGIVPTEAELAFGPWHQSGKRAGQALTVSV